MTTMVISVETLAALREWTLSGDSNMEGISNRPDGLFEFVLPGRVAKQLDGRAHREMPTCAASSPATCLTGARQRHSSAHLGRNHHGGMLHERA